MLSYKEERFVRASAEAVYDAMTDFESYEKWNPWIYRAEGNADVGSWVKVWATMGDPANGKGSKQSYEHLVLAADRPNYFRWCDVGWFTKLAYGERIRHIEQIKEGECCYKVELRVTGLGSYFAGWFFGKAMKNGLKAEADELTKYVEGLPKRVKTDKIPGVFTNGNS